MRLVFMMFFFLHLFACVWYIVIQAGANFVFTPDYYFVGTPRMKRGFDGHEYSLLD